MRKYLTSIVVEPEYPKRISSSKLDDYEESLTNWLYSEAKRHRKQRRSVKKLHHDLVSSTCLITFDRNSYSVTAGFANRPVSLRVYADRLVIAVEAQVVAKHQRVFVRDHSVPRRTIYDWRHYLSVVKRKPRALHNGAELQESFKCLQHKLLKRRSGDREMANILALVLLHNEGLVEQAVAISLAAGEPPQQHVVNCFNRLSDVPSLEPLKPHPHYNLSRSQWPIPLATTN